MKPLNAYIIRIITVIFSFYFLFYYFDLSLILSIFLTYLIYGIFFFITITEKEMEKSIERYEKYNGPKGDFFCDM